MTDAELAAFLAEPREARLATVRDDGDVHLTPVWFLAEEGRLQFLLESRRLHLRNLRRRSRATLLVDEDRRPREGREAGARAAVFRGPVEIVEDEELTEPVRARLTARYVGEPAARDPAFSYALCVLTPDAVVTWDFAKG